MEYLGERIPRYVARPRTWLASGFLPEQFRQELGMSWGTRDQARFDRFTRRIGTLIRHSPARVRERRSARRSSMYAVGWLRGPHCSEQLV